MPRVRCGVWYSHRILDMDIDEKQNLFNHQDEIICEVMEAGGRIHDLVIRILCCVFIRDIGCERKIR